MRLLTSVAVLLVLAGCSHSNTYDAQDVALALRGHGFHAGQVEPNRGLTDVLADADGVEHVIVELKPYVAFRPGFVPSAGDVVLGAFVFDKARKASCPEPNVIGKCFKRGNVVILVRANRARAAHDALGDL